MVDLPPGTELDRARRAQALVVRRFGDATWWRGAGLFPAGHGWSVRVDVAEPRRDVPHEVDGVRVEVRVVGDVRLRRH